MRKVSGIDALVERVVANLLGLKQVWVCGDLARGVESETIDTLLVGEELDAAYIVGLSSKVEKLTAKSSGLDLGAHANRKGSSVFVSLGES